MGLLLAIAAIVLGVIVIDAALGYGSLNDTSRAQLIFWGIIVPLAAAFGLWRLAARLDGEPGQRNRM